MLALAESLMAYSLSAWALVGLCSHEYDQTRSPSSCELALPQVGISWGRASPGLLRYFGQYNVICYAWPHRWPLCATPGARYANANGPCGVRHHQGGLSVLPVP